MVQFLDQTPKKSLIIISLTILSTGCVSQQQIVFLENEEWLVVQTLTLSAEEQQNEDPIIETWIELYQQVHDRPDTESVLEMIPGENGSVTYLLVARATGYNLLEETLLGRSITSKFVGGQCQITIVDSAKVESSGEEEELDLGDAELGGQIRIVGGQIIGGDAARVENGNTAIWETGPFFNSPLDLFTVNVTLTEVKSFSPDMIVLTRPPANVEAAMRDALNTIMPPSETTTAPDLSAPDLTISPETDEVDSAAIVEPAVDAEIVTSSDNSVEVSVAADQTLPFSGAIITQASSPFGVADFRHEAMAVIPVRSFEIRKIHTLIQQRRLSDCRVCSPIKGKFANETSPNGDWTIRSIPCNENNSGPSSRISPSCNT